MPGTNVAVVALIAAIAAPLPAAAEPFSSSPASIEQVTVPTTALFAASDLFRQSIPTDIAQVNDEPHRYVGSLAAYLDGRGLQAGGGTVVSAMMEQVRTGDNVAELVRMTQVTGSGYAAARSPATGEPETAFAQRGWLDQAAGDRNVAEWSQTGNANFLRTLQFGLGNSARQMQAGSELVSLVTQIGNANAAAIRQTGAESLALVHQTGEVNLATIIQENPRSWAAISQAGRGNVASVRQ